MANLPEGTLKPPSPQDEPKNVSFVCQRCLSPLRIDPSFYTMNEHVTAELTLPINPAAPGIDLEDERTDKLDLVIPSVTMNSEPSDFFTLVDETGAATTTNHLSTKLKSTAELFYLVSGNGEIDHPLCEECTDSMLETMGQQLKLAEQEAQEYQVTQLEKELSDLKLQEEKLKSELSCLNEEEKKAEEEFKTQMEARKKLDNEDEKYWRTYSKYKRDIIMAEDDYKSLDCKLRYTQGAMERIKKINVFNATFHIWHTGHFATINGFRLGRLPSVPVEWSEINAAWGHTAFLLQCLAKAIGMNEFQRYQLVPYGNFSYIKVLADEKMLPLYGTGGFRMIFDTKFDSAMVAFLDCLHQFGLEIEKQGNFILPYQMEKGKIRDSNTGQYYSIKLQFNSEDSWTKALRYMLTNLKWGLAFVSTKYTKEQDVTNVPAETSSSS